MPLTIVFPSDKEHINITEVAKMFKVASSLIRYWESEFDILCPEKDEKGNRRYTPKDIEALTIVYRLVKERGYTLKGAKTVLKEQKEQLETQANIISSLEKVKGLLIDLRAKI